MEYRRRKKSGSMRSRPRSRAQSSSGAGGMIVSLILIAGIVYIIVTSNAGEWVAREVMAPLFSAVSSIGDKANDAPSGLNNGSTTAGGINLSTGESTAAESANAVLPALNCYMLQMGVYSSHENAQKEAERLRALGAAGYIFADSSSGETRYRVMASGYDSEQSAKSVKDRLTSEGVEAAMYTLSSPQASFRVTADKSAIEDICGAFAAFDEAIDGMGQAVIRFDKESLSMADGKLICADILNAFDAKLTPLESFSGADGTLGEILGAYSDCRAQLDTVRGGEYQSIVDFSSAMKYTHLYIASRYAAMVEKLAG